MKISMFHLMPYRELPADFEKRYHSVWVDPPYHELADTEKIGQVLQLDPRRADLRRQGRDGRHLRQRASSERLRLHAVAQPDGFGAGARDQRSRRSAGADGRDVAHHDSADPGGRRVRDARLHQRRPPGGGNAARHADGREPVLRNHADGASRALLRGARSDHEGVAVQGNLRLERQVLQIADGQSVAAPDAEAASPGMDSGQRQSQHLGLHRQA